MENQKRLVELEILLEHAKFQVMLCSQKLNNNQIDALFSGKKTDVIDFKLLHDLTIKMQLLNDLATEFKQLKSTTNESKS